jgi:hypothetical protein
MTTREEKKNICICKSRKERKRVMNIWRWRWLCNTWNSDLRFQKKMRPKTEPKAEPVGPNFKKKWQVRNHSDAM